MKVLVMGGTGMLGHKMFQVLDKSFDTYVTFRRDGWSDYPIYQDIDEDHAIDGIDVTDFGAVAYVFGVVKPDVVINCIGIIKQVKELREPITSIAVNALFPHKLAELCAVTGTRLIHISTDCVFSGDKGNYVEGDVPDARDLYGLTKILGEVNQPNCLTIRTSILGRDFSKQSALLEWLLSNRGGEVRGYTSAIYSGFPTQTLARIAGKLIENQPDLEGLYHVASKPIKKHNLLVKIRDAMELDIEIEPYNGFYCDRSLDSSKFWNTVRHSPPSWECMITELASDDTPYDKWWDEKT